EVDSRLARHRERLTAATDRRGEVDQLLASGSTDRERLDEELAELRSRLGQLESEQEVAREARTEWQVQQAHVAARIRSARETMERTTRIIAEAERIGRERAEEIERLEDETAALEQQRQSWQGGREERASALVALETAAGEAAGTLQAATTRLDA